MKKIIPFFSAILLLLTVSSCEDDTVVAKELKLDKEKLTLAKEQEGVINILEGNGEYIVAPENKDIASFEVQQNNDKQWQIVVKALKVGTTKIKVTDARQKTAFFNVTVEHTDIVLEKYETEVLISQSVNINITKGSGNYTATSNNTNTTVTIEDSKITITGKEEGKSEITIKDVDSDKTAKIEVTVKPVPELTVDKEALKFIVGDSEANRTVTISGGIKPYTIIQWDSSNYSDPKTTVSNVTLDETTEIEEYGTTYSMKTGKTSDNTIIFNSSEQAFSEKYIIKDANGTEKEVAITVINSITLNETAVEVIVGQTINDVSKIKIKGLADRFSLKTGYDTSIIEASIEDSDNSSERALILKGLAVGSTTVTVSDGVADVSINVTVVEPQPMTLHRLNNNVVETDELNSSVNQQLGEFIIKGGTKSFTVTKDDPNNLLKNIEDASPYYDNNDWFTFKLERNTQVSQGGVVTITVKDNSTNLTKQFKVNCETLLELSMTINGTALTKEDSSSNPYYTISEGMYGGYNLTNISVDTVIEFTVKNGSGNYKVEKGNYGGDKIEITQTETNKTFTVKVVKSGTYYGDIVITDKNDDSKKVKITRIYN